MIEVIEGFGLGAGKSYYVLTRLIEHWKQGGTACVCDTMEILWSDVKAYVEKRYGYLLQDCQFHSFAQDDVHRLFEHTLAGSDEIPVVIVVDESQGKLNARDWADKSKRELFDWACQSRHDDNDLWFISQSSHNIDKQVRRLATFIWRIRNTEKWGSNIITLFLKCIKKVTFGWHTGAYFVVSQLDQDGKTLIGRKKWLDQDPDIFKCYRSKAMKGLRKRGGIAVKRIKLERKKGNIPWVRWAIAMVLVASIGLGCSRIVKHYSHDEKQAPESAKPKVVEKPKPPYDTRVEIFRNQLGFTTLTTDRWIYQLGRMCPDGIVDAISDGQVRVKQEDGRFLFILSDKRGRQVESVPVEARPTVASKSEIVVAKDSGIFPPVSDPFVRPLPPSPAITSQRVPSAPEPSYGHVKSHN